MRRLVATLNHHTIHPKLNSNVGNIHVNLVSHELRLPDSHPRDDDEARNSYPEELGSKRGKENSKQSMEYAIVQLM